MLIVERAYGQYSNRLFQNLYFECFCKEHNIEYYNPTFSDIAAFYINPCNTLYNLPSKHKIRLLSLFGFVKKMNFKNIKNKENALLSAVNKKNIVYVGGFRFRVPKLIEKYREELTKMYSLKPEFYENNDLYNRVIKLKQEENILIGIHIRRGDYKTWRNGKYYFEDNVYEKYMNDFSQKLSKKTNRKQVFVIFSNDNVKFVENENLIISKEEWFIDHHIMSICDYLIGPLSTFTLWANYIGRNTLFCIRDDSGNIDNAVSDFCENDLSHTLGEEKAKNICKKQEY